MFMIFGFPFFNPKPICYLAKRKLTMLIEELQEFSLHLIESARFWAKAINLLFKVCYLRLKLRSLRFRYLKFSAENIDLSRKQCDLLLLKINYIFFDSGISERI